MVQTTYKKYTSQIRHPPTTFQSPKSLEQKSKILCRNMLFSRTIIPLTLELVKLNGTSHNHGLKYLSIFQPSPVSTRVHKIYCSTFLYKASMFDDLILPLCSDLYQYLQTFRTTIWNLKTFYSLLVTTSGSNTSMVVFISHNSHSFSHSHANKSAPKVNFNIHRITDKNEQEMPFIYTQLFFNKLQFYTSASSTYWQPHATNWHQDFQ